MNARTRIAVAAGKTTATLLRATGRGGGALPGLVAERIDPSILRVLAKECSEGVILVSGTNGKTTVSRMIASMLTGPLIHNRSGSNMLRGHIAAFLDGHAGQRNRPAQALLEVDEAVLPALLGQVSPRLIVLTNLFRDQLDRYGEVDAIARSWKQALQKNLPSDCTVLINADDPNLAALGLSLPAEQVVFFGMDDHSVGTREPVGAVDAHLSPKNGKPLAYSRYYVSHLGDYGLDPEFPRPHLSYAIRNISLGSDTVSSLFSVDGPAGTRQSFSLNLPGLYSVYNAGAAAIAATVLGIPGERIKESLETASGAFGRFERIQLGDKELILCLIKNPAGATELLKTVASDRRPYGLAFCMNNNFADGQDVSWYWDTPYELIGTASSFFVCSGTRGKDMALRLKYAGVREAIITVDTPREALDVIVSSSLPTIYLFSTYTATLEIQKLVTRMGLKNHYWKE